jgi:hypothetical protein
MVSENQSKKLHSPELSRISNAVVDHIHRGTELPDELEALSNLYETDCWDELLSAWGHDHFALKLYSLAIAFSDSELYAREGLSQALTDADRVAYARKLIEETFANLDEYECPGVHAVEIRNSAGESAILGWLVEVHGQAGPVPIFQGVFSDKQNFYQALRDSDHVLSGEESSVTEQTILKLWSKPKADVRVVKVSVSWGYETHECAMSELTWRRVLNGRLVKRVVPFTYEGKTFKGVWMFNNNGLGTLLVTFDGEAVGFDGDLADASIYIRDTEFKWSGS